MENFCEVVSFIIKLQAEPLQLNYKEGSAQVFPVNVGRFEVFKNTFFTEYLRATASV